MTNECRIQHALVAAIKEIDPEAIKDAWVWCVVMEAPAIMDRMGVKVTDAGRPLTPAELRKLDGQTIYCEDLDMDMVVHAPPHDWITVGSPERPGDLVSLAKNLTLYRRKPEASE